MLLAVASYVKVRRWRESLNGWREKTLAAMSETAVRSAIFGFP